MIVSIITLHNLQFSAITPIMEYFVDYFYSSSGSHVMCIISSTIQTCLLLKNTPGLTVK